MKEESNKEHHFFRTLFFLILLVVILLIIYGKFLGNRGLIIKEYSIKDDAIPSSFNNFKIAQFADILYNGTNDEVFDELVQKINDKKVDIIIFSGNLIKKDYKINNNKTAKITEKLNKLTCKYGKYYVTGNDDEENQSYETIMQNSGFTPLNNTKDIIYSEKNESFLLVGMGTKINNLNDIINDTSYKIIVFSNSDLIEDLTEYNFNLAFSSNSLNGQVDIPFIKEFFLRKDSKNYYNNYYKVNNTKLYISSGIGTDLIDFRLFNKPSINLYILNNKNNM